MLTVHFNGEDIGRILYMIKVPKQKPKHKNRKQRRALLKAQGLLRSKE